MKIGFCFYPICDIGGIITHTEELARGLQELGHETHFISLCYQNGFKSQVSYESLLASDPSWSPSAFGTAYHPIKGWWLHNNPGPGIRGFKLAYHKPDQVKRIQEILDTYDILIWQTPVPTMKNKHENNHLWVDFLNTSPKHIAGIHDANLVSSTPWIHHVKHRFTALATVHPSSHKTAQNLSTPRAMLVNPIETDLKFYRPQSQRVKGFLACQIFKGCKHVDDIVRSIPYMNPDYQKIIAGGGIEQRYMNSPLGKNPKIRYVCRKEYDPLCPEELEKSNTTIWNRALNHGMNYLGPIAPDKRNSLLQKIKVFIDPSWSHKHSSYGDYFNRVLLESILHGVVPIGRNNGTAAPLDGQGEVFKAGKNFIMIPYDSSPQHFSELTDYACNLPESEAERYIQENYTLIDRFDRKLIAQQFVDLADLKPTGWYGRLEYGQDDPVMIKKGEEIMEKFFGLKSPSLLTPSHYQPHVGELSV